MIKLEIKNQDSQAVVSQTAVEAHRSSDCALYWVNFDLSGFNGITDMSQDSLGHIEEVIRMSIHESRPSDSFYLYKEHGEWEFSWDVPSRGAEGLMSYSFACRHDNNNTEEEGDIVDYFCIPEADASPSSEVSP